MSTTDKPQLIEQREQFFKRYAALSPELPLVLALWSLATHIFDAFDAFPYLVVTSPTKRCGKTRVAELLESMCANALRTVGITPAALFRIIQKKKPTLVIDEAESLRGRSERTDALREILNAGYKKGQKVIRCEGGNGRNYQPREFETFCPKVLVLIGALPETLADRTIAVEMKRRTSENLERYRIARVNAQAKPLHVEAKEWAKKNRAAVQRWYQKNDIPCLQDREAELWLPLFSVCAVAAPERLPELEAIAKNLAGMKEENEPGDNGIRLLADIRTTFASAQCERLATCELVSKLNAIEDAPWLGWSQGKGVDARSLSRSLRPFGIHPQNLRNAGSVQKGYAKRDFEDAWSRYLPAASATPATSATELVSQQDSAELTSATEPFCSGARDAETTNVYAACSGVAAERFPSFAAFAESTNE